MDVTAWDDLIRLSRPLVVEGVTIQSRDDVIRFYRQHMTDFGPSGRALAYPEEELYAAKLEQYHQILASLMGPADRVLDVGCGFGSLLDIVAIDQQLYTGVDLVPEFVEEARVRHPGANFAVQDVMDITERYDWVVGLGITGTVPHPAHLVVRMWELANKGLVTDFIDMNCYRDDLNCFDIGRCLDLMRQLGAATIRTHWFGDFIWVIFEALRSQER